MNEKRMSEDQLYHELLKALLKLRKKQHNLKYLTVKERIKIEYLLTDTDGVKIVYKLFNKPFPSNIDAVIAEIRKHI